MAFTKRMPATDRRRGRYRSLLFAFIGAGLLVTFVINIALDGSLSGDSQTWSSVYNNVLWIVVVPSGAVAIGLLVAVLADRTGPKTESIAKSMIFMPMAISFVGASVVWTLVYDISTTGNQIGLLNGIMRGVGLEPIAWLEEQAINDFALMVIMIWLQAGFAMVLLSAAIKGVPEDTLEAARIDGANEWQIFWRVVIPQINSTIVVVLTTILITVLKVFDIVRVLTNGRNDTQVVANQFFTQFENGAYGTAGVLVMLLVVATIPFMIINVKRFREQEANSMSVDVANTKADVPIKKKKSKLNAGEERRSGWFTRIALFIVVSGLADPDHRADRHLAAQPGRRQLLGLVDGAQRDRRDLGRQLHRRPGCVCRWVDPPGVLRRTPSSWRSPPP